MPPRRQPVAKKRKLNVPAKPAAKASKPEVINISDDESHQESSDDTNDKPRAQDLFAALFGLIAKTQQSSDDDEEEDTDKNDAGEYLDRKYRDFFFENRPCRVELAKRLRDVGLHYEESQTHGHCFMAALARGSLKSDFSAEDLDKVLVETKCTACATGTVKATRRSLYLQKDMGDDYDSGSRGGGGMCDNPSCGTRMYYARMCTSSPLWTPGRMANHCAQCSGFGLCGIGNIFSKHCSGCGIHTKRRKCANCRASILERTMHQMLDRAYGQNFTPEDRSGRSKKESTTPTDVQKVDMLMKEAGLDPLDYPSGNCYKAAIAKGLMKFSGKAEDLDTPIATMECDCGGGIEVTPRRLFQQMDNDCESNPSRSGICSNLENPEIKCKLGLFYVNMCAGEPYFTRDYPMHCTLCKGLGRCQRGKRDYHCSNCGLHYDAGRYGSLSCNHCGDDRYSY